MNKEQQRIFIEFWNSEVPAKEIKILFKISSDSKLYKYVKKLGLVGKRDLNHPYNLKLNSKIKNLYEKGYSIESISEKIKIDRDGVHKRLIKMNVKRRSCHERNVIYNENKQIKSNYTNKEIIQYIILNYHKKSINWIAKELKCDNSTIKRRIKVLGLT